MFARFLCDFLGFRAHGFPAKPGGEPGHLLLTEGRNTPNNISGDVSIFGEILICLAFLLSLSSWSVAICDDSIVILSSSLAVMLFEIINKTIVVVACFVRCIFTPESALASVF